MAKGNFDACLTEILKHEGGYVDHPSDPGGATNMGITHQTLARWRGLNSVPKAAVKALTRTEAAAIYEHRFWRPILGDEMPFGVDLAVFDYGVNSGPSRSVKDLQRVLGVKVDGVVGRLETLPALGKADGKSVIQKLCARRLSFMQSLKIWETFKRGWSRRVAEVEARAVAMWLAAGSGSLSAGARDVIRTEAGKAEGTAKTQDNAAKGAGGAGVGVGGGDAVMSGEPNWMLIGLVVVVVAVLAGVLVVKARQNKDRAAAYTAVAKGA